MNGLLFGLSQMPMGGTSQYRAWSPPIMGYVWVAVFVFVLGAIVYQRIRGPR